jgi:hypothetical protein
MHSVTVNLMGGLGNYLFQICAAYSYAIKYNKYAEINLNYLSTGHTHISNYFDNIFKNLNFINESQKIYHTYNEPFFNYKEIQNFNVDLKLHGYFQSEKYFNFCKNEIKNLFKISDDIKSKLLLKYGNIPKNSCSIHVRRGDYINLQHIHPIQTLDYYKASTENFDSDCTFYIFSDDVNWCENNFNFLKNKIIVSGNMDYEDLYLMSLCFNNIIANSSFSWWGAWLNDNSDKIVICPKKWFASNFTEEYADIFPEQWIKI